MNTASRSVLGKQEAELANGTNVPIINQPDKRSPNADPLPKKQEYVFKKKSPSNKVKFKTPIILQPGSQSWVYV